MDRHAALANRNCARRTSKQDSRTSGSARFARRASARWSVAAMTTIQMPRRSLQSGRTSTCYRIWGKLGGAQVPRFRYRRGSRKCPVAWRPRTNGLGTRRVACRRQVRACCPSVFSSRSGISKSPITLSCIQASQQNFVPAKSRSPERLGHH
jgi:hypothetical protein